MPTNENADYVERNTMLRSLLGDYLDRVKEREFDLLTCPQSLVQLF